MAQFCHFWHVSPAEFWELDMEEYDAMTRHMQKVHAAQQAAGSRRGRR